MAKIDLTNKETLERVAEIAIKCIEKNQEDYTKAKVLFFKEHEGVIGKEDVQGMEEIFHRAYRAVKQG